MTKRYLSTFRPLFQQAKFNPKLHLQASEVATYAYQEKLPKQPIPPLEESGKRFKHALEALEDHPAFGPSEIKRLQGLWDRFEANEGPAVDKLLREIDSKQHESFVNPLWTSMYLADRVPVLTNYNPAIGMIVPDPTLSQGEQASVALHCVGRYYCTLRDQLLQPDGLQLGKRFIPLDMHQYKNLLYSTRIPGTNMDSLKTPPAGTEPKHACVLHKGHFYTVEVFNEDMVLHEIPFIHRQIEAILVDGKQRGRNPKPTSALSLTDRNLWAKNREYLSKLGDNEQLLDIVDTSMTLVVLDDFVNSSPSQSLGVAVAGPGHNRWPDKSFSLVVNGDSSVVLNFEHAWGDGAAILNIERAIHGYLAKTKVEVLEKYTGPGKAPLQFETDDFIEKQISEAESFHNKMVSSFRTRTLEVGNSPTFRYPEWFKGEDISELRNFALDRSFMKKHKVGADGFMQISLQLAAAEYYGHHVNQYEAAAMGMFYKGRTETVRSCTPEVVKLFSLYKKAKQNKQSESMVEMVSALRVAAKAHSAQIKDCLSAKGFDRHLAAMKIYAAKNDIKSDFLEDTGLTNLNTFHITTSTLEGGALMSGGFGPVTPNGFGIGYIIDRDWTGIFVSGFKDNGADADKLAQNVYEVWSFLYEALELEHSLNTSS